MKRIANYSLMPKPRLKVATLSLKIIWGFAIILVEA